MLTFMDYVAQSFGNSTSWNRDNTYSSLTATSEGELGLGLEDGMELMNCYSHPGLPDASSHASECVILS